MTQNVRTFFEIVRAGLFPNHGEGGRVHDSSPNVDWGEVYRLAEEQSVVGLVSAGLDWFKVNDSRFTVPQTVALQFIGQTLQIEQRNKAMNGFLAEMIDGLRRADVYTLVVKGQGIAQCYERPLWRSCGDVDLLLSKSNYDKAKAFLQTKASHIDAEDERRQHLGMTIDGWIVELHGTLLTGISKRLNKVISQVQDAIFLSGEVRSVSLNANLNLDLNDNSQGKKSIQVFLPSPDNDAFLVFSHILEHFYVGGIGLRQICDWCRLLWTYRKSLNHGLLESRLHEAGIMTEWKGFAAFAVDYLGMPVDAFPFYEDTKKWHNKADRLCALILETGNFGHNKDESYRGRTSKIKGLMITFGRRIAEYWKLMMIFPTQVPGIFVTYVTGRVKANV